MVVVRGSYRRRGEASGRFNVADFGAVEELADGGIVLREKGVRLESGGEVHVADHPAVESGLLRIGEGDTQDGLWRLVDDVY